MGYQEGKLFSSVSVLISNVSEVLKKETKRLIKTNMIIPNIAYVETPTN